MSGNQSLPLKHIVQAGEGADSIAFRYGFFPLTVWDAPENEGLRAAREDRNILQEGDVLFIPARQAKPVAATTGQRHVFRRRGVPAMFRAQLLSNHVPRANVPYVLIVEGVERRGTTDDQGRIEVFMPPDSREATLIVDDGEPILLGVGLLDPIQSIRGVQQRLANLGYRCAESGELDDATVEALRRFQEHCALEETGALDDATREKLRELHDTPALLAP